MKIGLINNLYYPNKVGGAELSVQELAEGLAQQGNDVSVLSLGVKKRNYTHHNVTIHQFPVQNVYNPYEEKSVSEFKKLQWHWNDRYNVNYFSFLDDYFNSTKPDLIHTHNLAGWSVAVWDWAKTKNLPVLHTLRDYYLQCPRSTKFKNKNCTTQCMECKILSTIKKSKSQKVDHVIGISKFILDEHVIAGYFKNAEKHIIYNGIAQNEYLPHSAKPKNKIRIGYLGRLHASKGFDYLIQEFKNLPNSQFELIIGGEIPEAYKSVLSNTPYKLLGYVSKEDIFNEIDILVIPSLWKEPFGRVVIEALQAGKIVLGSKNGAIPEIIKDKNLLFDTKAGELQRLLRKIYESFEEYQLKASNLNMSNFTKERVIQEYSNLYQKICKG